MYNIVYREHQKYSYENRIFISKGSRRIFNVDLFFCLKKRQNVIIISFSLVLFFFGRYGPVFHIISWLHMALEPSSSAMAHRSPIRLLVCFARLFSICVTYVLFISMSIYFSISHIFNANLHEHQRLNMWERIQYVCAIHLRREKKTNIKWKARN